MSYFDPLSLSLSLSLISGSFSFLISSLFIALFLLYSVFAIPEEKEEAGLPRPSFHQSPQASYCFPSSLALPNAVVLWPSCLPWFRPQDQSLPLPPRKSSNKPLPCRPLPPIKHASRVCPVAFALASHHFRVPSPQTVVVPRDATTFIAPNQALHRPAATAALLLPNTVRRNISPPYSRTTSGSSRCHQHHPCCAMPPAVGGIYSLDHRLKLPHRFHRRLPSSPQSPPPSSLPSRRPPTPSEFSPCLCCRSTVEAKHRDARNKAGIN